MRVRAPGQLAGLFGKAPGDDPDWEMCMEVLDLLCHYGRHLPVTDKPGPLRPWQIPPLRDIIAYNEVGYEAARQGGGKTMLTSLYLTCDHILGNPWAIGMPTLEQSAGILMRRVLRYMGVLEKPLGMHRDVRNVRHVTWDHGAELRAMSTNEAGVVSSQGYTYRGVVIDEAHEMPFTSYGFFTPLILVAGTEYRDKMIIIGPAGTLESTIESVKNTNCRMHIYNDERISAIDDAWRAKLPSGHPQLSKKSWRQAFREEEQRIDPAKYNQFYRLIPVTANGLRIFPGLPAATDAYRQGQGRLKFTVDVAKLRDAAVCGKWRVHGTCADLIETRRWHAVDYFSLARELAEYILAHPGVQPRDVAIEVNGPGEPLVDIMVALYPQLSRVRRVKTTDNYSPGRVGRKTRWLKYLIGKNLRGELGVAEPAVRGELSALAYAVGDNGRYDWPHSDNLSVCFLLVPLLEAAVGL